MPLASARSLQELSENDLALHLDAVADVPLRRDLHVEQPQREHDLDLQLLSRLGDAVERDHDVGAVRDEPEGVPLVGDLLDAVAAALQLEAETVLRDLDSVDLGAHVVDGGEPEAP